ncbi:MAG: hypothetical protein ACJ74Q_15600 [Pyrinomonadaceae bacterium]
MSKLRSTLGRRTFVRTTAGSLGCEPKALFSPPFGTRDCAAGDGYEHMTVDVLKRQLALERKLHRRATEERKALTALRRKLRRWHIKERRRPATVFDFASQPESIYGQLDDALSAARPGIDRIVVAPKHEKYARLISDILTKGRAPLEVRAA